jgi:fructan beta-fructosidase
VLAPGEPAIHLAPLTGWMNDPNGLVCVDGVYHAFYQHHPDSDIWGPMHWGHATSSDLIGWKDQGVAIAPDSLGAIFSGCAVVDHANSSGFGGDGDEPVVAVFTHDSDAGQRQSLAYSLDKGRTFQKYAGNPVLEADEKDFRDPKVSWFGSQNDGHWVMCIAVGHRIEFYRSQDLRTWSKSGEFSAPIEDSTGIWECPDLLPVPLAGATSWVLLVAVADAGPQEQSGVAAFVGDFDGSVFRSDQPSQRLDSGPDFYAAQSFSNVEGDPLVLGWMNSWQYANTHPSRGRRGVLSLPRRLRLDDDRRVVQQPVFEHSGSSVDVGRHLSSVRGEAFDLLVGESKLVIGSDLNRDALHIEVGVDAVVLSRTVPGMPSLDGAFSVDRETDSPVRVMIDHGTIEIFADDGRAVMSALFFTGETFTIDRDSGLSVRRLTGATSRVGSTKPNLQRNE